MMKGPTSFGTSMNHLTIHIAEPNLSSSSHLHAIFQAWMWDLMEKSIKIETRLPKAKPHQPIKQ